MWQAELARMSCLFQSDDDVSSWASVMPGGLLLLFAAPGAILQFVRDTTTRVEGVGDVCSLAVFDFDRHGNRKYGALAHANKRMRSKQVCLPLSFNSRALHLVIIWSSPPVLVVGNGICTEAC